MCSMCIRVLKQLKKLIIMAGIVAAAGMTSCHSNHSNPLLTTWNTPYQAPPFEQITVEHYRDAFQQGMREQEANIKAIVSDKEEPAFENTIAAFDRSGELLGKVAAVFFGMVSAQGTPEMLELEVTITPELSAHSDRILMNEKLFRRVQSVYENKAKFNLNTEQEKLLADLYRHFVRSGAKLSNEDKEKLKTMNQEISTLETQFGQNVLAETAAYELVIENENELTGLPDDLKVAAAQRAVMKNVEGKWVFGLDNPSVMPFLQYSSDASLREKILTAYLNRGNNNNAQDNKEIIKRLVSLRNDKALLLGYQNFAAYELEERMAKTPAAVYNLLDQVWTPALNCAKQELADMESLAKQEVTGFKASDWRFYSGKIREQRYNLSEEMTRPYFQSDRVRDGIFWVCNQLYGITFREITSIPKPHPDASVWLCVDSDGATELGVLYIDLFARPGLKRGGAWCGTYRDAHRKDGKRELPIVTVVCNFSAPLAETPSLLTADETETFFHEFGHALHALLCDVEYLGTTSFGVPNDFVELPSQIMEHWAFEPQVLEHYAFHYQTGEIIPKELVEKIKAASMFGKGFATVEYLAASYLDMDYHIMKNPQEMDVLQFEAKTLADRGLIPQIPPRYRSTYFLHTMTGGYTAGYYSYLWSELLDADGFKAFKETGDIFNKELAEKFRRHVLQPGGSEDPMTMYINFRGAAPGIEPLLENRGLK